jgi:hypothetical protein
LVEDVCPHIGYGIQKKGTSLSRFWGNLILGQALPKKREGPHANTNSVYQKLRKKTTPILINKRETRENPFFSREKSVLFPKNGKIFD